MRAFTAFLHLLPRISVGPRNPRGQGSSEKLKCEDTNPICTLPIPYPQSSPHSMRKAGPAAGDVMDPENSALPYPTTLDAKEPLVASSAVLVTWPTGPNLALSSSPLLVKVVAPTSDLGTQPVSGSRAWRSPGLD